MPPKANVFSPEPWQVAPWKDTSPIILLSGGAGGGKSTVAANKCHGFMMKYPGATGLILRKERASMAGSTILFYLKHVVGNDSRIKFNKSENILRYPNGSLVVFAGMADAEQSERIRSIGQSGGVDFCWMEEATAFVENDFNEILPRMRGTAAPWTQILMSTNPAGPGHWIYKRIIEGKQGVVYYSFANDNSYNPASYRDRLELIQGVKGKQLREGKWIEAEGIFYPEFDLAVHVLNEKYLPPSWRRIRAVDFGYENPFVCQWWAIDPEDNMYMYREIYKTRTLITDHIKQMIELTGNEQIEVTVTDHDTGERALLEREGIYTTIAYKERAPGFQAVRERLRIQNGKPKIYFLTDALVEYDQFLASKHRPVSTTSEFSSYVYAKGKEGRPDVDLPIAINDHGMDAMRYAVAHIDQISQLYGQNKDDVYSVDRSRFAAQILPAARVW